MSRSVWCTSVLVGFVVCESAKSNYFAHVARCLRFASDRIRTSLFILGTAAQHMCVCVQLAIVNSSARTQREYSAVVHASDRA